MIKIDRIIILNKVGVPVDEDGHYLDWKRIQGTHAEPLVGPFGPGHFVLGDNPRIILDFAVLPNGHYILKTDCSEGIDLHIEDRHSVVSPENVPESAYYLVSHCIESLERSGVKPADPWKFFRKILCHVGDKNGRG